MNNEFVPYSEALAMKELGHEDDDHFVFYFDDKLQTDGIFWQYPERCTAAPLYQQAFRWFREKHNIQSAIGYDKSPQISGKQYNFSYLNRSWNSSSHYYHTHEEAQLACLQQLIKIVQDA